MGGRAPLSLRSQEGESRGRTTACESEDVRPQGRVSSQGEEPWRRDRLTEFTSTVLRVPRHNLDFKWFTFIFLFRETEFVSVFLAGERLDCKNLSCTGFNVKSLLKYFIFQKLQT